MFYDTLIIASGSRPHYFGHDDWETHAPGLKTIEDAFDIRRRMLVAFEATERETEPEKQRADLTFVVVGADCGLPTHPDIFVIGDLASHADPSGKLLPGVAPVAQLIHRRLRGQSLPAFRYRDRGMMAIVGRSETVADLGCIRFAGRLAWFAWLFIHLAYLVTFQNRLLVWVQ